MINLLITVVTTLTPFVTPSNANFWMTAGMCIGGGRSRSARLGPQVKIAVVYCRSKIRLNQWGKAHIRNCATRHPVVIAMFSLALANPPNLTCLVSHGAVAATAPSCENSSVEIPEVRPSMRYDGATHLTMRPPRVSAFRTWKVSLARTTRHQSQPRVMDYCEVRGIGQGLPGSVPRSVQWPGPSEWQSRRPSRSQQGSD